MKKNNLFLVTILAITAILFSSGRASSSSDITSTEKVEGSTKSTESVAVVTIGTQVWTSKNLDIATYRNGDVIPQIQDEEAWAKLTTGAWCYYDNDASNGIKYGKLYNWYALNDPRGIAPKGFHIPNDAEWIILTDYLGGKEAFTKMKSTSGWYKNGKGTNSSGFSGLPGGSRYLDGSFSGIGTGGFWWRSPKDGMSNAYARYLSYEYGIVSGDEGIEKEGYSIRCLRD